MTANDRQRGRYSSTGERYSVEFAAEIEAAADVAPGLRASIRADASGADHRARLGRPIGSGRVLTIEELANALRAHWQHEGRRGGRLTEVTAAKIVGTHDRQLRRWLHAGGLSWTAFLDLMR